MIFGWKKRYMTLVENSKLSALDGPFMSIVSDRELMIENHNGIINYYPEEILVKTGDFIVNVSGENLFIESLTRESINIMGRIKTVNFERM